jgi:hypothetical protein
LHRPLLAAKHDQTRLKLVSPHSQDMQQSSEPEKL